MDEFGLDLSKEFPKPLTTDVVEAADVVVTMGCGDACPIFPGKRYLDWELTDPSGKSVEEGRPIRDEIDRRVRGLLARSSAFDLPIVGRPHQPIAGGNLPRGHERRTRPAPLLMSRPGRESVSGARFPRSSGPRSAAPPRQEPR